MTVKSYDLEFKLRSEIARRVRDYVSKGGKINQLAVRTGLSGQTISNLVYGDTQYPRLHTAVALLVELGIDFAVIYDPQKDSSHPVENRVH
jgi:hypothetical protein